ncbi:MULTISPECIES: ketopantoate reductase family protein [Anaerolinea]|uniref:ketopantoate reductase family protein n=1 Tax=Anaerolinea TaxID=233189 RepID=UPI0026313F4A|nr:2-dehydropantoate 2-reductase [Anaerolinea thermophila]
MAKPHTPKLKFLCFGAGAIGGYIGGSLILAGHSVTFLERPEQAEALKSRGLVLQTPQGTFSIFPLQVVSSLEETITAGPYDLGILAVKSYDTQSLLETLSPYAVALPPVLSLQNGVENEMFLACVFGTDRVISGTVTTAVGKPEPGVIVVERLRGVGIADEHPLAPTLAGVMDAAGLRARLYTNGRAMKWSKMLTNLMGNATSAILDMTPAEIYADPHLTRLEVAMLREAVSVMRAMKIPVVNLPGTPVKGLIFLSSLPIWLSQPLWQQALGKGRGGKMPSFQIDLKSGRGKSEVEFLNGAVVRFGQQAGVPTPINQTLTHLLMEITRGNIRWEDFRHNPAALLKACGFHS